MNDNMLKHVSIIMDGNRRWARERFLPEFQGHKAGADALKSIVKLAQKLGIKYLSVYAFSTENWNRSDTEVKYLMHMLRTYIKQYSEEAERENVKFTVIGELSRLNYKLKRDIKSLVDVSSSKTGINFIIAVKYGGRNEILRATKLICRDVLDSILNPDDITEDVLSSYLDTRGIPDPDLLIRTSGECRLSNFLPWQLSYSELYFTNKLWPDFTEQDLLEAIEFYKKSHRRFGGC